MGGSSCAFWVAGAYRTSRGGRFSGGYRKCHLSVMADTEVFGQLLGRLGLKDLGNDRGHIDGHTFMLRIAISTAVSSASMDEQAR